MNSLLEEKLREAACVGDSEAIEILLDQKVDLNSQNQINGWTALHWAAKRGHDRIVALLLARGADPTVVNFKGDTAGDVCSCRRISDLLTSGREFKQNTESRDSSGDGFVLSYIKNTEFNAKIDLDDVKLQQSNVLSMPNSVVPSLQSEELVLKIRVHGSPDLDFIEIEIPRWKLTYSALVKICCEELEVNETQVERIRKLPNTRLRKDNDVKRLTDFQELEIVLKDTEKSSNCYQSISSKDQVVLY